MTTIESTRAAYEAAIRADERARILATLNGVTAKPSREQKWRTRAEKAADRRKGQKRDPATLRQTVEDLAKEIGRLPGKRIEQIAAQMGEPTRDLALPVKKLIAAKRIKTTGHKRATRYFPRAA